MMFQCGGMSVDMGVKHHSAANVQEVHQQSLVKPKFTMAHFGNPMVCLDFPYHKGPKHGFIGSFSDTAIGLQTQAWTTVFEMGVGKPMHQIVRNLGFSHFQGPCQTHEKVPDPLPLLGKIPTPNCSFMAYTYHFGHPIKRVISLYNGLVQSAFLFPMMFTESTWS